jgi:hypothetical protein
MCHCRCGVFLFQWKTCDKELAPEMIDKFEKFVQGMECGVMFDDAVNYSVPKSSTTIHLIIGKYGLLQMHDGMIFVPKDRMDKPFKMRPASLIKHSLDFRIS